MHVNLSRNLLRVLAAALIGILMAPSWASPSFDVLLDEADRARTSDPARFKQVLVYLDRDAGRATPAQLSRLQLLHAYEKVMSGDPVAAIEQLHQLRDLTKDVELQYRAGALLANAHALTRDFAGGLAVLEQILPLQDRVSNRDARHQGLLSAAILYNQVGQYQLGSRYAEKILADQPNARSQCFAGNLKLESMHYLGISLADGAIMANIKQCEFIGESVAAFLARSYLARKLARSGEHRKALDQIEPYLPEIEATLYPRLIAEVHSLIAENYFALGDSVKSARHADRAIELSRDTPYSMPMVMAYKVLYEIALRRGDKATALDLYRRYAEADKAYLNDVKTRELAYQIVRQETMEKTQKIELLNRQNEVLKLQQEVDRQSVQYGRIMILLLLLLLTSTIFWLYKIKRAQISLRHMAQTDALTGIGNRHHFTIQSEAALEQSAKTKEELALVMFDMDHFKLINDRYGHVTGDWVLKQITDTCRAVCRKIDYIGRIGGEEFAMLLYGCDLYGAARIAEDCRVRIAAIDTQETGHAFSISSSFGVTSTALSGYDLAKLMSHADQMLYRAKREGRNRVCVYSAEMHAMPPHPPSAPPAFAQGQAT